MFYKNDAFPEHFVFPAGPQCQMWKQLKGPLAYRIALGSSAA